ncbi:MAG: hypothetical protein QXS76_00120 [Candidatus Bathyarchaeia archaeon]
MSHFALIGIKIRNPNLQLLRAAIERVAKELGAQAVKEIEDFYGNKNRDFIMAIRSPAFRRGIGVKVEGGEVKVVGDFYGVSQSALENFQNALARQYAALATVAALNRIGYRPTIQQVGNKILIRAAMGP